MSAFMQGLQTGSNVASGFMDTYERSRRRREEEDLKRRREEIVAAQPEDLGLRYTPEQGEQLRMAAETGMYDIEPGDGGYRVSTREATPQMGLVAPEQRVSQFMGQEFEGGLTPQRIQELRDRAMLDTVTDPIERQRLEASQLQMQDARTTAATRVNTQRAKQMVAQRLGSGEIIDVPTLYQIAEETGADASALVSAAASAYDLTTKQAKTMTDKLINDINTASTSPKKFNELLANKFDPDPTDGVVPELRIGRDGSHQVFYGEEPYSPVFTGTKDLSAMAQLSSFYSDQISGNRMATAVQVATLDKIRAQTQQARAAAAASERDRPNMRDLTTFQNTQLTAYNKWLEDSRNANAPQAVKDNKLKELGIENLMGQMASGSGGSGLPDWTGSGRPAAPAAPAAETGEPVPATTPAQTPGLSRGPSPALQEQMRRMPITRFTGIGTLEQAARFGNEAAIRELERRDASAMQLGTRPPLLSDMGLQ